MTGQQRTGLDRTEEPRSVRGPLAVPKHHGLVVRLSEWTHDVNEFLMNQLRLVPSYFVDEFNRITCDVTRNVGEMFKCYMYRLSMLLWYYLRM